MKTLNTNEDESSNNHQEQSPVLTKREFCKLYKVSTAMLDRLLKKGVGPKIIKFQHKMLISRTEAEKWIKGFEINFGEKK